MKITGVNDGLIDVVGGAFELGRGFVNNGTLRTRPGTLLTGLEIPGTPVPLRQQGTP